MSSRVLDQSLADQNSVEEAVVKLLLLGTAESGKSTIFKQVQLLYSEEKSFSAPEQAAFRHVLRVNAVESMQSILRHMCAHHNALSSEATHIAQSLCNLDTLQTSFFSEEIANQLHFLWTEEKSIQDYWQQHRTQMQIMDSAPYLFDHIKRIGAPHFVPTHDDILRARLRTTGVVERTFRIEGTPFKFIDVGGQRNERRKWIHCFDKVTAILFVSAVSEFDQVLFGLEKSVDSK